MLLSDYDIKEVSLVKPTYPRTLKFYRDNSGKEPFTTWLEDLGDLKASQRIQARLFRVEQGNYGDFKALDDGVFELRCNFGPGYRIYFGEDGDTIVVILCGGDKSSQSKDIKIAKVYWQDYLRQQEEQYHESHEEDITHAENENS
ncbi:MAG: type II toxin-antitoxin system RelE/ParE family toxin [Calothrix sp. SM1_7_51]|nr:type II toxin-antitoxin system RelE/ParE family toxin [Calothrix sp. SM1_7_51]